MAHRKMLFNKEKEKGNKEREKKEKHKSLNKPSNPNPPLRRRATW
jgi:hypothetical protein